MSPGWIKACDAGEIELEDVIRFDHGDRTFAVYRTKDNKFYATDGLCTHGHVHLADGLVMGHIIECPKHNGQFDFTSGRAQRIPACVDLKIYPVRIEDDQIFIQLGEEAAEPSQDGASRITISVPRAGAPGGVGD